MHDRPTAIELLEAVRHFLEEDVVPALEGPKKFHARVAANVMSIVTRELELEDGQLAAEWNSAVTLLGDRAAMPLARPDVRRELKRMTEQLCDRIRAGDADGGAWRDGVLKHLRRVVRHKLEVASPGMLRS